MSRVIFQSFFKLDILISRTEGEFSNHVESRHLQYSAVVGSKQKR